MWKYVFVALATLTALLAGLGFYLSRQAVAPGANTQSRAASDIHFTQPFTLTDMHGQNIDQTTYLGKPTLYFFGFTHCPDVCPGTLGAVDGWMKLLGDTDALKFNVVFVSVDPARDTPEMLRSYVTAFNPRFTAATGTDEEVKNVAKIFMVYYAREPEKDGTYMVNHSSMIILADAQGTFRGTLDAHDPTEDALKALKNLL